MIVELCSNVTSLSNQIRNNDQDRNRVSDLNETRDEILKLKQQAMDFARIYGLLKAILGTTNNEQVQNEVQGLINSLQDSQKDLSKNPRQVPIARSMTNSLATLITNISVAWYQFAVEKLMPAFKLFDILRNLPEFKPIRDALLNYKKHLEFFQSHVPKDEKELLDFAQTEANFSQIMTTIPDLTPKIQSFLAKIMDRTATVADLDNEIYAWCREPGRSKSFMVTFKN
jgi:hypothetical protein